MLSEVEARGPGQQEPLVQLVFDGGAARGVVHDQHGYLGDARARGSSGRERLRARAVHGSGT